MYKELGQWNGTNKGLEFVGVVAGEKGNLTQQQMISTIIAFTFMEPVSALNH